LKTEDDENASVEPRREGAALGAARHRYERILHEIRERIILLDYPPGMRLNETELAGEFGVSRTPIRRVLGRLEYEGFIRIRQGSGNYVTRIKWDDLVDAYVFRMRLAELIGDLSPGEIDAGVLARLEEIQAEVHDYGYDLDPRAYRRLNGAFQDEFMKLIGNRELRSNIHRLYVLTQRHWHEWQPWMDWRFEIECFHWQVDDIIRSLKFGDLRGAGLVWRNVIAAMLARLTECRKARERSEA